ncbi:glycosyltransferase family 4 protein [Streptomyces jeddahensis]|uniref:D-inositol 3-phosphate glycosyltransferase n=1 Tax=Streptomyces jeddahensis TaxID=1716141 RepID=A0A177HFC8_9ACTN|nr:glycosyltransferase family 4 protein [Streptomyces jeddahensis]OAH09611.1 D-inositol 3-phosphate glycosyltransferase [Streptomyces jeddahensis]
MRIALAGPADIPLLARLLAPAAEPGLPPGLGSSIIPHLATEFSHGGHEVTVVTLSRGVEQPVRCRIGPVDVVVGGFRTRHYARDALRAERRTVSALLDSLDVDLAHAHWTYEFALGALATRHPVLVTVHDWAPAVLRRRRDAYRAMRMAMQGVCVARARHMTAVSPYVGQALARFVPRAAAVVPNGVPDDFCVPDVRTTRGTGHRVLSISTDFDRLKNGAALIAGFASVRAELPGVRLTLAGHGYEPGGPAETWARARGLADGIVFAGPVPAERVPVLLDDADLFVAPTLEESFGMTVLESMARGLPVVGGHRSGAVPWLLDGGRAGVLVDVRRPRDIARGILGLALDSAGRERIGRAALARAREFTVSASAARYLRQYRHVVRGTTRGAR